MTTQRSQSESAPRRADADHGEAFDRLFARHKDGVHACLWHLLDGDSDQVEEAVGNVFLNAYRALPRFRGEASMGTWLYRIAVNEAHARRKIASRRRQREAFSLDEGRVSRDEALRVSDPAVDYARTEEERILVSRVNALPEPYRTPLILRYFSDMSSREIGAVLKRPDGTVRYQLSRALEILRERLGDDLTR